MTPTATATTVTVRSICAVLSRKRLLRLAEDLAVAVDRKGSAAELGEDLERAAATTPRELVELLTGPEWLALCSACRISDREAERGRRRVPARAKTLRLDAGDEHVAWESTSIPQAKAGRGRRPKETQAPDDKGSTETRENASAMRAATDTHASPPLDVTPTLDEVLPATQAELEALRRENAELRAERDDAIEIAAAHESAPKPRPLEQRRRHARARLFAQPVIEPLPARPLTRADCARGPRPCRWTACRFHLGDLRRQKGGRPAKGAADLPPARSRETCLLDVTDRGAATLEEIATTLGVTRERVRQIEAKALVQVRSHQRRAGDLHDFLEVGAPAGIGTPHIGVDQT
jgi:hypothetical protein